MKLAKYVGWIKAKPQDLKKLMDLGVEGKMDYNKEHKCFECCEIKNIPTMKKIKEKHKPFWFWSFTAVDEQDDVLPNQYQIPLKGI